MAVARRPLPAPLALDALESGEADLAAGGFTEEEVNTDGSAAPSIVYHEETIVVAGPPGGDLPEDIEGARVFVPPEVVAEARVRRRGGVPVSDQGGAVFAALPHWQVVEPRAGAHWHRAGATAACASRSRRGRTRGSWGWRRCCGRLPPDVDRLLREAGA